MSICKANLRSGRLCVYPAKHGDYCGYHKNKNQVAEDMKVSPEIDECPICMIELTSKDEKKLSCGHCFHETCPVKWEKQGRNTCPICRRCFIPYTNNVNEIRIQNRNDEIEQVISRSMDRLLERLTELFA